MTGNVKISSSINKNLIAISLVSTLLIFWLSASFWFEAFTQRSGAAQLQVVTQPEETLFKLAMNLGKERALLHTILARTKPAAQTLDSLYEVSLQSKQLLDSALQEIRESRAYKSALNTHRYDDQKIEQLLSNLSSSFEQLSQDSSIVVCLLYTSPSPRDRTRSRMPSSA